ncbi:hypothetical protein E1B28_006783 [Marasmius oreades]|uniref:Uncharacterized protein n=1 Tax=Marasmius oreades TaxID=181124 RepID=A0A9P7UWT2_9AGAR|nr:uncharacterized protein E1B28_006783 [Marasmius oreades]KAG7096107.1 hypothetical protein E1B28_006783 [Marasmius oreades]
MADQDDLAEVTQYFLCLAKSPRSSDMQGYAVRLSAFVANICIAILIAWSKEDVVKESVNVVMLQNFVIMISSAIAMGRKDILVADAHFALALTMSPLSIYFVYSTFRFFRRRPNHLYDRLGSAKFITAAMSMILLICWVIFDLLIYFSNVYKSEDCKVTLIGWTFNKAFSFILKLTLSSVPIALIPLFWIVYFIRHFKDIREEYRRHMTHKTESWERFRLAQRLGRSIKSFVIAQWDVITRSHKWLFLLTILAFYLGWAASLYIWIVNINERFHVAVTVIEPDPQYTPTDFDPLGYGQLLAAAIVIQPIWGVFKLAFLRKHEILLWIKQWPKSVWNGIVFIFTGDRNPWKEIVELQHIHESEESVTMTMGPTQMCRSSTSSLSPRRSRFPSEESLVQTLPDGGAEKAKVTLSRSPSPQFVPTNYDPYSEVLGCCHDAGLSRHRTV